MQYLDVERVPRGERILLYVITLRFLLQIHCPYIVTFAVCFQGTPWDKAITLAKGVLKTLTKDDKVSVICARGSGYIKAGEADPYSSPRCHSPYWYTKDEVMTCAENKLVSATTTHIGEIMNKLDGARPSGGTDLLAGFQKAYSLLESGSGTGCKQYIVFISDDYYYDTNAFLWQPQSYYVPGTKDSPGYWICLAAQGAHEWNTDVKALVASKSANPATKATIFSYNVAYSYASQTNALFSFSRDGSRRRVTRFTKLTSDVACSSKGEQTWISDQREHKAHEHPWTHMRKTYLNYLQKTSGVRRGSISYTSLYLDGMGLGLMITLAAPIYNAANHMVAVAGVDVTLGELTNLIRNAFPHDVDAFVVDDRGKAIMHPRLVDSSKLTADPMLVGIKDLETQNDQPTEFGSILAAMMSGQTGNKTIRNTNRFHVAGDVTDGVVWEPGDRHYWYGPLPSSSYRFGFNLGNHDLSYKEAIMPPRTCATADTCFSSTAVYHQIQEVQEGGVAGLGITSGSAPFGVEPIATGHCSFKLAPKCFCDPVAYLDQSSSIPNASDIHTVFNAVTKDTTAVGCTMNGPQWVRNSAFTDVRMTNPLRNIWDTRQPSTKAVLVWTYFGTERGVMRVLPASRATVAYDPTRRPWYRKAVNNHGEISVSSVYLDAFGAGKVVTMALPAFQKKPATCQASSKGAAKGPGCSCITSDECSGRCYGGSCSNEMIEGVLGVDILYDQIHAQTLTSTAGHAKSCGEQYDGKETLCYVFDSFAHLVFGKSLKDADVGDTKQYQSVGLGWKEPAIMNDLVYHHKIFDRIETVSFEGACRTTPYAPAQTLEGMEHTSKEKDEVARMEGKFTRISQHSNCVQDIVSYKVNLPNVATAFANGAVLTGTAHGICHGPAPTYTVVPVPETNTYLLVVVDVPIVATPKLFNFGCHIMKGVMNSGGFKIVNGSCVKDDAPEVGPATCAANVDYTISQCHDPEAQPISGVGHTSSSSAMAASVLALLASVFTTRW